MIEARASISLGYCADIDPGNTLFVCGRRGPQLPIGSLIGGRVERLSEMSASIGSPETAGNRERAHMVQFYDHDEFLVDSVARFIGTALGAGGVGIVIATRQHLEGIEDGLRSIGLDLRAVAEDGRYVPLDAAATLAGVLVDGRPDAARFREIVGSEIERASQGARRNVHAFGEMVALLWNDGKRDEAIVLEQLWNELGAELPFSLLCAYPIGKFQAVDDGQPLVEICKEHSHVLPAESYASLPTTEARSRAVTVLQQKAIALERETAQRAAAEKSLVRKQRELSDFLENAAEGLQRVGPDGRVIWANRALLDLLGYEAAEYIGHELADFHADRDCFTRMWQRLLDGDTLYDCPARLVCRDGSIRDVLVHSNVMREDGRFLYTRCFVRDVTEQKRLEDELRSRIEQLAEIDRRKDEFLAMLSHELRNPLAAVQNAVVTARVDEIRRDRALQIARRQTDQLVRLVDDLLDVARITQGRINLRTQRVRFGRVVERAVESTRQLLDERAHHLSLSLSIADVDVEGDATRLEQALVNLISNAAKYTEPGGRIQIVGDCDGEDVVLRVGDNGIGIAPEMLSRVFDMFAQAEQALDRSRGGLGIGLTVVRRVVELHGGTVEASSHGLGYGAEFELRLPVLAALPETGGASADLSPSVAKSAGAKVLLVEDNPDAAESLMMLLELLGHSVRVANDGISALTAVGGGAPDVMLVDIGLPGIDGYEVARRIRSDPHLAGVILVALTGYGRDEDRERAIVAGFDYHLVKPIELDALRGLVERLEQPEHRGPETLH